MPAGVTSRAGWSTSSATARSAIRSGSSRRGGPAARSAICGRGSGSWWHSDTETTNRLAMSLWPGRPVPLGAAWTGPAGARAGARAPDLVGPPDRRDQGEPDRRPQARGPPLLALGARARQRARRVADRPLRRDARAAHPRALAGRPPRRGDVRARRVTSRPRSRDALGRSPRTTPPATRPRSRRR